MEVMHNKNDSEIIVIDLSSDKLISLPEKLYINGKHFFDQVLKIRR